MMNNLSTYAGLRAAVADYLGRDDLDERIPTFIRLAEVRMKRDIRAPGSSAPSSPASIGSGFFFGEEKDADQSQKPSQDSRSMMALTRAKGTPSYNPL